MMAPLRCRSESDSKLTFKTVKADSTGNTAGSTAKLTETGACADNGSFRGNRSCFRWNTLPIPQVVLAML